MLIFAHLNLRIEIFNYLIFCHLIIVCLYHGLFLEMKRLKGGRIADEQVEFLQFAKSLHYASFVCRGAEKAKQLITQYLLEPESLAPLTGMIIYENDEETVHAQAR